MGAHAFATGANLADIDLFSIKSGAYGGRPRTVVPDASRGVQFQVTLKSMAATKKAAPKATNNTRVGMSATEVTQRGLKGQSLLTKYPELTPRLPATLASDLASDLTAMGAVVPAVTGAQHGAIQSTAEQTSALEQGYNMITAVRMSVARARPSRNVALAYGVGTKVNKLLVKDVVGALQKIVNRATAQAAEAASFGVLAADVTAFTAQIATIKAMDQAQEQARAAAPQTTKQRNATLRRILYAVDRIAGAGMIQFANDATTRELFAALIHKGA